MTCTRCQNTFKYLEQQPRTVKAQWQCNTCHQHRTFQNGEVPNPHSPLTIWLALYGHFAFALLLVTVLLTVWKNK